MQGLGNDFICMIYDESIKYNLKIFSKFLCDRHYGIGADGLIFIGKSKNADISMRIFNSDGSEAEMCGNGIRCVAKYVYDKKILNKNCIYIETYAGIKKIEYIIENGKVMEIKVNMGKPILNPKKIPIYLPYNNLKNDSKITKLLFNIKGKELIGSCLSMGNPHTVIEVDSLKEIDLNKYGQIIEKYKYFPSRTNVEFVEIINDENIKIGVFERGVGRTLACGTGACASAFACFENKKVKRKVRVELEGGYLNVEIDGQNNIYLIGDAVTVYEGVIDF